MTTKNIIGLLMMLAPFIAFLVFMAILAGLKLTLMVLFSVIAIITWIGVAFKWMDS